MNSTQGTFFADSRPIAKHWIMRWLVGVLLVSALSACAAQHIEFHSFGFDIRRSTPAVEVLNYRYGTSNSPGTRAPAWLVAEGKTFGVDGIGGSIPVGETLYVKWRIKDTWEVFEETVDLKSRLPSNIEDHKIYFDIKGSQLYVYLVSMNVPRPADSPLTGPRIFRHLVIRTLYPDTLKQKMNGVMNSRAPMVKPGPFTYFAAIENARNDLDDSRPIGPRAQGRSVGQRWDQYRTAQEGNPNLGGNYYPSPATAGTKIGPELRPWQATPEAIRTGEMIYKDFTNQFSEWLRNNPSANPLTDIKIVTQHNDPGVNAKIVFAQNLFQEGISDPITGRLTVPPGVLGRDLMMSLNGVPAGEGVTHLLHRSGIAVAAVPKHRLFDHGPSFAALPIAKGYRAAIVVRLQTLP